MIRWIIESSLKFRLLISAFAALLIVLGIIELRSMPMDVLPEFAPPYINVQTEALGLSVSEVEELVTFNLEELLNGTPWLQSIQSTSLHGLSSVTLFFKPGTDVLRARQLVNERLSLAYTLPNVAKPPVILQPLSAMSRVLMIGLSTKQLTPLQLSVLVQWRIRPALLSVPGVANVAVWGMRDQQLQVLVDPKRLQAHQVNLEQIVSTTGNALWVSPLSFLNASTPGSGGWLDTPQQRLEIRHVLPIATPNELAQVIVEDTKLRLGEVADVVENHQPLIGDNIINNGQGLLIIIEKFPGANTLQVTEDVIAKLKELEPGMAGIQSDITLFQPANFIKTAIYNTTKAFCIGFFLLAVLLFLFMYSWRAVLVSLITILVSLSAVVFILGLLGITMNAMTLLGLIMVLAIIVDDAILEVENNQRRLRQYRNKSGATNASIILESCLETRSNMMFATLILFLTVLPILFLNGGPSAVFFHALASSFVLALLISLLVTVLFTPALCLLFLSEKPAKRDVHVLSWLQRGYNSGLNWIMASIAAVWLALGAFIVAILAFAVLAGLIYIGLPTLPEFKESDIAIKWEGPPGTSLEEMLRITNLAGRELRKLPGVRNVVGQIGRAVLGDQVVNANEGEIFVSVDPNANYDATLNAIEKVVAGYPGIYHVVQTYFKEKIQQALTGVSADIVVRIFGPDFTVLNEKADQLKKAIEKLKGVADVHIEHQTVQPEVAIEVDLAKAQGYGLKPGDIRRAAATYVAGIEAGSLFQHEKVFQVVVWGEPSTRQSLTSISDLLIATPNAQWVPLNKVANVSIVSTPSLIKHETVSRYVDISLNVSGDNPAIVMNNVKEILKNTTFPLEYHAVVRGMDQPLMQLRLLIIALVIAIAVFLIFQAAFDSFTLAAIIFFTLPSVLIGSVLTAFTLDDSSFPVLLGLLAVYGIATRNVIMLIKHYQSLETQEADITKRVARGTSERFRPIVISLLAAAIILLPFVWCGNIPGLEITGPIALVIFVGLFTTALYILFIVPSLYLRWGHKREEVR